MNDLTRRLLHMVGSGRVSLVNDSGPVQRLQVTQGGPAPDGSVSVADDVIHPQDFGFASHPPLTSELVLLRLSGNRTLTLAIACNHQPSRMRNLQPGDSALYDVRGASVHLTPSGLVIDGAGLPATIRNVGKLTVEGDLDVTGAIRLNTGAAPVTLGTHTHGGVQPGAGTTAPPNPG